MNKAFTKESDYDPAQDLVARPRDPLPPGGKNYITPAGAARIRGELRALLDEVRPALKASLAELVAAGREDDDAHRNLKRHLRQVEQQVSWLQERVAVHEIVEPAESNDDHVRFGARVTVADANGKRRTWRIVGVDEADPGSGDVSWISPIARALLGKEPGDAVTVALPKGRAWLEIVEVSYPTD